MSRSTHPRSNVPAGTRTQTMDARSLDAGRWAWSRAPDSARNQRHDQRERPSARRCRPDDAHGPTSFTPSTILPLRWDRTGPRYAVRSVHGASVATPAGPVDPDTPPPGRGHHRVRAGHGGGRGGGPVPRSPRGAAPYAGGRPQLASGVVGTSSPTAGRSSPLPSISATCMTPPGACSPMSWNGDANGNDRRASPTSTADVCASPDRSDCASTAG